jgi:hypothetical protein
MRGLSRTFITCLQSGFLSKIMDRVRCDHDLNFEIRDCYINIYFKGNSLLKLVEAVPTVRYKAEINARYLERLEVPLELTEDTLHQFLAGIPHIKENIIKYGQRSLELEYEQMIIRANNFERRNNTEYFILDRQYAARDGSRFDLVGMYWERNRRQQNQEVPICLMEIKFALNHDIHTVHAQLARYYEFIKSNAAVFAEEMETVFRQKLALGLSDQSPERLNAMKTLTLSRNIKDFRFILVLVDYNQNSSLLPLENLRKLPFADQVWIFRSGFGMWQHNVSPIGDEKELSEEGMAGARA